MRNSLPKGSSHKPETIAESPDTQVEQNSAIFPFQKIRQGFAKIAGPLVVTLAAPFVGLHDRFTAHAQSPHPKPEPAAVRSGTDIVEDGQSKIQSLPVSSPAAPSGQTPGAEVSTPGNDVSVILSPPSKEQREKQSETWSLHAEPILLDSSLPFNRLDVDVVRPDIKGKQKPKVVLKYQFKSIPPLKEPLIIRDDISNLPAGTGRITQNLSPELVNQLKENGYTSVEISISTDGKREETINVPLSFDLIDRVKAIPQNAYTWLFQFDASGRTPGKQDQDTDVPAYTFPNFKIWRVVEEKDQEGNIKLVRELYQSRDNTRNGDVLVVTFPGDGPYEIEYDIQDGVGAHKKLFKPVRVDLLGAYITYVEKTNSLSMVIS